jgi:hypothetical protein
MAWMEEKIVVVDKSSFYQVLEINGKSYIDCRDPNHCQLRDYISSYLGLEIDSYTIDDFGHRYPVTFLLNYIPSFKAKRDGGMPLLVAYLEKVKTIRQDSYKERQKLGKIEMGDLELVFPQGTDIVYHDGNGGLIGGQVQKIDVRNSFFTGPYFIIQLKVIHAIKGEIENGIYSFSIGGFYGLEDLKSLPICVPTDSDKEFMSKRGEKFAKFFTPGQYVSYNGILTQPSYWSARTFRADGRVVIDPVSFQRAEPEIWRDCIYKCGINIDEGRDDRATIKHTAIDPADYWRCAPFLYGFSLAVKQWGRLELDGMSEINWRDDAWDKLVLDEGEKDLIFSLVKFHGQGFTDIIEGKGGGCIFLLHGKPGWGKTCSAEAVAELLHKPLYSVGVGELGTDTTTLEEKLRSILDVGTIWDAVILLDEADIFLEERDDHNIARNAMVGVFLRLLEYHNGVLFLTTNRVKKIDEAFYSRISVALHYKSDGKALKIWQNLLTASKLNPAWANALSSYDINGRQIKNSIRMAQTLARAGSRPVDIEDLKRAATAAISFEREMKKQHLENELQVKAASNND